MHLLRRHQMPDFVEDMSIVVPTDSTINKFSINYGREVRSLFVSVRLIEERDDSNTGPAKGIFDSGAQSVCISEDKAKHFEYPVVGHAVVNGATGTTKAEIVRGDFHIIFDNGELMVREAPMFSVPLPGDVDILIGQPIIKHFDFEIGKGFKRIDVKI